MISKQMGLLLKITTLELQLKNAKKEARELSKVNWIPKEKETFYCVDYWWKKDFNVLELPYMWWVYRHKRLLTSGNMFHYPHQAVEMARILRGGLTDLPTTGEVLVRTWEEANEQGRRN